MNQTDDIEASVCFDALVSCMTQRPGITHSRELLTLLDPSSVSTGTTEAEDNSYMEPLRVASSSEAGNGRIFPLWNGIEKFLNHEKGQRLKRKRGPGSSDAGNGYSAPGKRRVNDVGDYIGRVSSSVTSSASEGSGRESSLGIGSDRRVMPLPAELEAWKYVGLMKRSRNSLTVTECAAQSAAQSAESQTLDGEK